MKLLHTSDWHIGRQFHNVSLLDDQAHVLDQLIGCIDAEGVDAVIVAGDVYDRSVPPADAVALLNRTLRRICVERSVPVILISGNHDSAERLGFGAELMQGAGLHIISSLAQITEPVVIEHDGTEVAFYGIPYCGPEPVRNHFNEPVRNFDDSHSFLVDTIKSVRSPQRRNVLISHCFVAGGEVSESERPLSVGGADTVGWQPMADFDYVALGHLHAPQSRGRDHIRYCGSLLKYSFSEVNQRKGITLVTLDGEAPARIEHRALIPHRDMRVLEGGFDEILASGDGTERDQDYLLVRLTDKKAILDTLSQLRAVFPNVLHLEKPGLDVDNPARLQSRDQLKRTELELFGDFYEQARGEPMNEAQQAALQAVIREVHADREERT